MGCKKVWVFRDCLDHRTSFILLPRNRTLPIPLRHGLWLFQPISVRLVSFGSHDMFPHSDELCDMLSLFVLKIWKNAQLLALQIAKFISQKNKWFINVPQIWERTPTHVWTAWFPEVWAMEKKISWIPWLPGNTLKEINVEEDVTCPLPHRSCTYLAFQY